VTVFVRGDGRGAGYMGSPGAFGWTGMHGTMFWVDPADRLAVVLMVHAPGEMRVHVRRLVNALAYQGIVE